MLTYVRMTFWTHHFEISFHTKRIDILQNNDTIASYEPLEIDIDTTWSYYISIHMSYGSKSSSYGGDCALQMVVIVADGRENCAGLCPSASLGSIPSGKKSFMCYYVPSIISLYLPLSEGPNNK